MWLFWLFVIIQLFLKDTVRSSKPATSTPATPLKKKNGNRKWKLCDSVKSSESPIETALSPSQAKRFLGMTPRVSTSEKSHFLLDVLLSRLSFLAAPKASQSARFLGRNPLMRNDFSRL